MFLHVEARSALVRQDKGGLVEKEDPFMKLLEANRARLSQKDVMPGNEKKARNVWLSGSMDLWIYGEPHHTYGCLISWKSQSRSG